MPFKTRLPGKTHIKLYLKILTELAVFRKSSQELHTRHWKIFQQLEERKVFHPKKDSSMPKRSKGKKDEGFLVAH